MLKGVSWSKLPKNTDIRSRFKLIKQIGEILNGAVFQAEDLETKQKCAVKYLNKAAYANSAQSPADIFEWEMAGLKLCDHPFIHDGIECIEDENRVYLVTELCNGDLYYATEVCDVRAVASKLFMQIAAAVGYIHASDMCHRDIKPENVFVLYVGDPARPRPISDLEKYPDEFQMKLGDFGFWASTKDADGKYVKQKTICGSEVYTPPEIKNSKGTDGYDGKMADIWSLGVTLFVLQINFPPWESCSMKDPYYNLWITLNHVTYWKVIETHAAPGSVTPAFKDLFTNMCQIDVTRRFNIQKVFDHPYLTGRPMGSKMLPTPRVPAAAGPAAGASADKQDKVTEDLQKLKV